MTFQDRTEAGRRLAALLSNRAWKDLIILALPRGGVPVAAEIAKALGAPLQLLISRKIGVPGRPELAAGAVVDGPHPVIVRNEEIIAQTHVSEASFERVKDAELEKMRPRSVNYQRGRTGADFEGQTVIVVDDGIATGATMRAALLALRQRHPQELIVAVPVGQIDAIRKLEKYADEVVCVEAPSSLGSVGRFYRDFRQVSDGEVMEILARFPD